MANKSITGGAEPKADSHVSPTSNPETPTVDTVVDRIEVSAVKSHGDAIIKVDRLLVETEARGTIYCLSIGLIAKQALFKLKEANPKKKQSELLQEFIVGLKLSAGRSTRTIQRYIQLVDKMTDDQTLTGVLRDALGASNFTDDVRAEVQLITGEMGITDLYVKYRMLVDKPLVSVEIKKTIEDRLMDEVVALINTHTKLMKIRGELVGAGDAIDPSLDDLINKTCEALVTLSKHPVIAAMLKKLEDALKAAKETKE